MSRMTERHEHTRTTLSVEKELLELFNKEYPNINISYLLEVVMQEALRLKGINYTLYEDEIYERKAEKVIKGFKKMVETANLGWRIFSRDLLDRVEREGELHNQFL